MTKPKMELIFLGTGCSTGVPDIVCLTNRGGCKTCHDALVPESPNKRLSTSLLIKHPGELGQRQKNILIDSGKFLPETALKQFIRHNVDRIDAVVITHAHFDAIAGMDALRSWTLGLGYTIPIYLRQEDMDVVKKVFFYIADADKYNSSSNVANLQFNIINSDTFDVLGLKFTPLRVKHGENYYANGYQFGNVCYISDVSEIPDSTKNLARDCEVLILDALRSGGTNYKNHLTLEKSIETALELNPKRVFFIGMTHNLEHSDTNKSLREIGARLGMDIQLAHDGLLIETHRGDS